MKELMNFDQISHIEWYWQYFTWDYVSAFSFNFYQGYCPWLPSGNGFPSISCERNHRFWSDFTYRIILTLPCLPFPSIFFKSYCLWLPSEMVSIQYLWKELTDFDLISHIKQYWPIPHLGVWFAIFCQVSSE